MCSHGCSQSHSDSLLEWMKAERTQTGLPSGPTTLQPADIHIALEIGLLLSVSLISGPVVAQCRSELEQPPSLQLGKYRPKRGKGFLQF